MKKILTLIVLSLFLLSCVGPGAAVSKNVEDISINVKPAAAGYRVELYSQNLPISSAVTNSQGVVTFYASPIGSYRAVVLDAAGAKAEKSFSSKWVQRGSYTVTVEFKGAVVPAPTPVPPTIAPQPVCTPNQVWCSDIKTVLSCSADGSVMAETKCGGSTPWCVFTKSTPPTLAKCAQCRDTVDCGGNPCVDGTCVIPELVCKPSTVSCSADGHAINVCNYEGTRFDEIKCTPPEQWCLITGTRVFPLDAKCVQCRSNGECPAAKPLCSNNVCTEEVCVPTALFTVTNKCIGGANCGKCAVTAASQDDFKYAPAAGKLLNPLVSYNIELSRPVVFSKMTSIIGKMEWCGWMQIVAVDTNNNEYRLFVPAGSLSYDVMDLSKYTPSIWTDKVLDKTVQIKAFKILLSPRVMAVAGRTNVYEKYFGARLVTFELSGCGEATTVTYPFCGDGAVNQINEQCDIPDDRACPGLCIPRGQPNECKCPVAGVPPPPSPVPVVVPIPTPPPVAFCGDLIVQRPREGCEKDADCPPGLTCNPPGSFNECLCAGVQPLPPAEPEPFAKGIWVPIGECVDEASVPGYLTCPVMPPCPSGLSQGPLPCTEISTICYAPPTRDLPYIPNVKWYEIFMCIPMETGFTGGAVFMGEVSSTPIDLQVIVLVVAALGILGVTLFNFWHRD